MKNLRPWLWGDLPTFNGFSHAERVRGWQLIMWRMDNGWWERPSVCSISGQSINLTVHSENYYSWEPYTLNRRIHMTLHRRFKQPEAWRRLVDKYAVSGSEWFAMLPLVPSDIAGALRAKHGPEIADIFRRAPLPPGITIPYQDIYR